MAITMSAAALSACGGPPPTDSEPLEGASLVAGTSIPRHGLLVIPRDGGVAELRAVEDPNRIRWSGTTELPATRAAYSLGRSALLHGEDGAITVFQPSGEVITEIGTVPADARWIDGPDGGAFVWAANALVITERAARTLTSVGRIVWAAPASEGRSLVLSEVDGGTRLELWDPGAEEPSVVQPVVGSGPALVTGWGREIVLAEGEDGRTLVGRALPDLAPTERARLDAAPVLLASSPSQHRLFAASAGDSRLEAIDRYGWRTAGRVTLEGTIRAVRPSVTGEILLAFDGARIWGLRAGDSDAYQVGSDWRIDLPLGLPGDRVIGAIGGTVRTSALDGSESVEVDGPADAWWVPIRWTPRSVEPIVSEPPGDGAFEDGAEEPAEGPVQGLSVGLTTLGRVAGRAVADLSQADIDFVTEADAGAGQGAGDPFTSIPDGFYAVATSSRQLQSLRALQRSLEGSGYTTEVLSRRDEANDLWYRLMVGPYRSRSEAEEAAASLQRERGISAWIHEAIGGGP